MLSSSSWAVWSYRGEVTGHASVSLTRKIGGRGLLWGGNSLPGPPGRRLRAAPVRHGLKTRRYAAPHTGLWGVQRLCLAPPLRLPVTLPPAADHGQGEEGEEQC